ncbi:hypothetical protein [Labrenzia sp. OB1]|uniref:hypothetical protein n=1 Tax=Labrenzia sp. OB1 TaxID=1561204 RepID=UPI0012E8D5FF|nr:hypothetical protein [Labrenzia sp. OB1]
MKPAGKRGLNSPCIRAEWASKQVSAKKLRNGVKGKQMAAPKGNDYAKKWKTSRARKEACKRFCDHIAAGYSLESFADADKKTIRYYAEQYPDDFPADKLQEAARKGLFEWEKLGKEGTEGLIDGFNASSWKFNMQNRAGWRDKTDVESRNILGGPEDAAKIEALKPRSDSEIALGIMALLTKQKTGGE